MYEPHICLYHAGCTDGFGGAWAIWRRWPSCTFIPAAYGEPLDLDDIEGRNILFVDFSAPAEVLRSFINEGKARSVIVLDHHKTAKASLAGLPTFSGDLDFIDPEEPILVWFDMEKSGAMMAWKFAHPGAEVPALISHIEDRDLWRFRYPETKQVIAALNSYAQDFQTWDMLKRSGVEALIEEGEPILRAQAAIVETLLREAYSGDIAGHTVPLVNAPGLFASDVGHRLLEENPAAPFAGTWFRRADGLIQFSLRSQDHRQDVSEIAVLFGGGGHRNAAGFQLEMIAHGHKVGAV